MEYFTNLTVGTSPDQLLHHARLKSTNAPLAWAHIQRAYRSVKNYPVHDNAKQYLRNRLLLNEPPRLWQLLYPSVLVYRFPNGELRFFLIADSGHICEDEINKMWYKSFPFIIDDGKTIHLDLKAAPVLNINNDLAWFPQSFNYSHFLCDTFSPWLPFADHKYSPKNNLVVAAFDQWKPWQHELLDILGIKSIFFDCLAPGASAIVKPHSVFLPTLSNPLMAQYLLRTRLHRLFSSSYSEYAIDNRIPIYLSRNDERSSRIRNAEEIASIVLSLGGQVIDPSTISFQQKYLAISRAKYVICEGSGSINSVLFAPEDSTTIMLTDPLTLVDPLFLDGGFAYLHSIAHRLEFVVGDSPMILSNSPLASCTYSANIIQQLVTT